MEKHLVSVMSGDWYDESNDDASMKYAKECGIEAIDFNIDHVIYPNEYIKGKEYPLCDLPIEEFVEHFRPLKEASEKYGVKISQMHAPFPLWFEDNPEATDYLMKVAEKTIATAAFCNCPAIVIHPIGTGNRKKDIEINLKMYQRLIPAGKKYGVTICLENLFSVYMGRLADGACSNYDDAIYLIDTLNAEAGEKVFGFCFDVGHANATGKRIKEYLVNLGDRLTCLHIHDNNGMGDMHMIPYTQVSDMWAKKGATDWEGLISGLREIGYEGNLSFETFKGVNHMPKDVEPLVLKLIVGIGKYFRKRIEE